MYCIILKLVLYLHRKRTDADREQREANGIKVFKDFNDFKAEKDKNAVSQAGRRKKTEKFLTSISR